MAEVYAFTQTGFTTGRRRLYKTYCLNRNGPGTFSIGGRVFTWEVPEIVTVQLRHCSVDENGEMIVCHDDHNQLASLQGGAPGEFYHLSFDQHNAATSIASCDPLLDGLMSGDDKCKVDGLQDFEYTLDAGVEALEAVFVKTDGKLGEAKNNSAIELARVAGIMREVTGLTGKIYRPGELVENTDTLGIALTPGSLVYLDSTAGRYSSTAPVTSGQFEVPIGVAQTATSFYFLPKIDDLKVVP